MPKVNRVKSPLFFRLESLETRLDKFSNGLDKFSKGLEHLETRLEPRSSKFSRIEDRGAEGSFSRVRCSCTSHWVPTSPNRRTADTADPSLLKPSGTATLPSGRRGADAAALRLCPKRHGLASVGRAAAARREWRTAGGWCFTRGWTSIFHPKDERGLVFQACTRNTINKTRTRAAIISCRTQHSRAAPNITPCR